MNKQIARRALHAAISKPKTSLYGWGQAQALPLKLRDPNAALCQPQCLNDDPDYDLQAQEEVTHVAAGWGHSLLGTNANRVYGFGLNRSGQLGSSQGFFTLETSTRLERLGCGREHSHVVVKCANNGTQLFSFGSAMYGQLGLGQCKTTDPGHMVCQETPQQVSGIDDGNIIALACGLDNTVVATDEGAIYAMGWGADGQLGLGTSSDANVPTRQSTPLGANVKKLAGSTDFTLALTEDGKLWTWGNSEYGQGMTGAKVDRILEPVRLEATGYLDVAAGGPFSVVLTEDGKVHTCGYGALGLGKDMIETLKPTQVPGLSDITRVYATTDFAAAISSEGELYTWGLNSSSGRLGLGHMEHAFTPQRVPLEKKVLELALGTYHVLAICEE